MDCLPMQVHRVQNQKLWKLFSYNYRSMEDRWKGESSFPLVNGGLSTLWHGTSHQMPDAVYASETGVLGQLLHCCNALRCSPEQHASCIWQPLFQPSISAIATAVYTV